MSKGDWGDELVNRFHSIQNYLGGLGGNGGWITSKMASDYQNNTNQPELSR